MTYIHVSRTPTISLEEYDRVRAAMGPEPLEGNLEHHVGVEDGALCVVDVWTSRDHADRFAATRLFPAFAAAGVHPADGQTMFGFDATAESR